MKTKCQWPDCGQKIEYDETMANQKYICPACKREIYLIPQLDLKHAFGAGIKSFFRSLYSVYFDTKAVKPTATSPYQFVMGLARAIYIFVAGWLLVCFILIMLQCHFASDNSSETMGLWEQIMNYPRLSGTLSCLVAWLVIYWGYKLTRVIFDIAEYLRQIANK